MIGDILKRKWGEFIKFVMRYAVAILIILFIIANLLLFISYQQSNHIEVINLNSQLSHTDNVTKRLEIQKEIELKKRFWSQIWSFCGTDTFKTVEVSILLAVLLAALGKVFKIKEAFETRVREQRQKRIDAQKICIEDTAKMWSDLYCLVSEVRFFKKDGNDGARGSSTGTKPEKESIEDILKKIENFASTAEEVVNKWHFVFPELSTVGKGLRKELEDKSKCTLNEFRASWLILILVNVLYDTTASAAYHIRKIEKDTKDAKNIKDMEKADKKIKSLQDALGVIQDVIKDMVHQSMLGILKYAVEPIEGWGENKQNDDYARNRIKQLLKVLFEYAIIVKVIEEDVRPLPEIEHGNSISASGKGTNNLGDRVKMLKQYKGLVEIIDEKHTNAEYCISRFNIVKDTIITKWEYKYTEENLKKLAKYLCCISISDEKEARKKWEKCFKPEK